MSAVFSCGSVFKAFSSRHAPVRSPAHSQHRWRAHLRHTSQNCQPLRLKGGRVGAGSCGLPIEKDIQSMDAPEAVTLPEVSNSEELQQERKWLAGMITLWLDEEWTPLEVHTELGRAAGRAYAKLRQQGETDLATVLLGLSTELMSFDFTQTFTDPFEVANKISEMLMLRMGIDVCCISELDRTRSERYKQLSSEAGH